MEAVVGLLVMLLGVSHGVETCDGRRDGAQCNGALGGSVVLQLMDDALDITKYDFKHNQTIILRWRNKSLVQNLIKNRSVFVPSDGTLRINNLNRNDSGEYTLEMFGSDGSQAGKRSLQLSIQAPVSSVLLVSECLSQGDMNMSCSSEGGDSPQYRWTLDGRALTDSELLSGHNEADTITVKQNVSGYLVCSVSNTVSSVCGLIFINCTSNGSHTAQHVLKANNTQCIIPTPTPVTHTTVGKETSNKPSTNITSTNATVADNRDDPWYIKSWPIMAGVLVGLVIFLVVGIFVIRTQKKQNNKPTGEDDQELTYADVRVMQRQGRQVERRAEMEVGVEYGQVKFSERPRQTDPVGDACVYAKVRKGR